MTADTAASEGIGVGLCTAAAADSSALPPWAFIDVGRLEGLATGRLDGLGVRWPTEGIVIGVLDIVGPAVGGQVGVAVGEGVRGRVVQEFVFPRDTNFCCILA